MDRWNKIVEESKEGKIYHSEQWGELLKKVHGHKLIYLEEEKGVFPLVLVKSFIFGNRLISLPFADYGGPLVADQETLKNLISRAERQAQNLKVDFMEIRTPGKEQFVSFENQGFSRRDDYFTYIISLDKEFDLIWKEMGFKNRNKVKRAQEEGVEIKEMEDKAGLKVFYKLYLETMKKLGSPPQPFSFFENIWDLFYPKNLLIILAICQKKAVAAGLFFLCQETIHHAYSCSSQKNFKTGTNNLINWEVIKWGKTKGFKFFDLGRTRQGAGNVAFKKQWGGKKVSLPYFYKFYRKKIEERQEIKYKKLSALWAKCLPSFMAKKIGPWLIKQIG